MNKIKLIYDVVKTMKEKDVFKGTLRAEGLKDQDRFLVFENDFKRDNSTGKTSAKIKSEVDHDGKKMKMDNNLEFEGKDLHGHHFFKEHIHHCPGKKEHGLKDGFGKILFVLSVLNNIKFDEQEDKSVIIHLSGSDIPEDMRKALSERIKNHGEEHKENHGKAHHHEFMKEFHQMENSDFNLNIFVNKNNEVERINLELKGEKEDEKAVKHGILLQAELCLAW